MAYRKHIRSISSLLLLVILLALAGVRTDAAFGDADTTFGPGTRLYGGYGVPEAAALQPDGKILVITRQYISVQEGSEYKLRRFHSNGTVDTSFGFGGAVWFADEYGYQPVLRGLAVQPDGKIVVISASETSGLGAVRRVLANGSMDLSFGTGGVVMVLCTIKSVHLTPNPQLNFITYDIIVSGGYCNPPGDMNVVRLKPDGSPRTTFGSDGYLSGYPFHFYDSKVVVRGNRIYLFSTSGNNRIAKFSASTGDPDLTFGDQGVFEENPVLFDGCDNLIQTDYDYDSMAFQSTGKFLIGGTRTTSIGTNKHLTRHNPDGSFDIPFSSVSCESGTALTPGAGSGGTVNVQADDKIILTNKSRKIVERRMPDGTIDASFTAVSSAPFVMIQPDGKILIVGLTNLFGSNYLALSRYLP